MRFHVEALVGDHPREQVVGEDLLVPEFGVVVDLVGNVEEQLRPIVDVRDHALLGLGQIHRGSVSEGSGRPGSVTGITEHLQVQEIPWVAGELGDEVGTLDAHLPRVHYDVRGELDLELMILQLKVMHHLLEAMRPRRSSSTAVRGVRPNDTSASRRSPVRSA